MDIIQNIDEQIVLLFQSIRFEVLTQFFKVFVPYEFWYVVAAIVVVVCFFQTRALKIPVISFFLALHLSNFFYTWLKDFVQRPRPFLTIKGAVALVSPHGFSFPSGHATFAMAIAVVLSYHFPKTRYPVFVCAVLVGLSRVYLGAHYLTDVLGGFIYGALLGYLSILLEHLIIFFTKGTDI